MDGGPDEARAPLVHSMGVAFGLTSADVLAGITLRAHLAGLALPEALPSDAMQVASFVASTGAVPEFLRDLAGLYEHGSWTLSRFEREFVLGAMAALRPGTLVRKDAGGLRVLSPGCPIASDVARDPRVCQFCRAFQEQVARTALPGEVVEVRFDQLAHRDGVCEMDIRLRGEARS